MVRFILIRNENISEIYMWTPILDIVITEIKM